MPSSTVTLVLYFAVFFGIVYFLMIRPQQKQQKQRQALLSSLKVKDKVITVGGIYGKIIKVKDKSVILQIADKVEVEIAKAGIASVENREIAADDKKNKEDKNNSDESGEKAEQEKAEA